MENKKTPLTQNEIASKWLPITIKSLHEAMDKKGIRSQRRILYNSVVGNIVNGANGDVRSIFLRFLFYGRFVDMGVGQGVPIGGKRALGNDFYLSRNEKGQLNIYRRTAKKWYSPTIAHEQRRLMDVLLKHLNIATINVIERGWGDDKMDINI